MRHPTIHNSEGAAGLEQAESGTGPCRVTTRLELSGGESRPEREPESQESQESTAVRSPDNQPQRRCGGGRAGARLVLSVGGEQDRSGVQEYLFPRRFSQPAEKVELE